MMQSLQICTRKTIKMIQTAVCLLAAVPMRKEPSHRSEMVSQVLMGEYVSIGEEKDDFVSVKCLYDGYEGWIQANQLSSISDHQVYTTQKYISDYTGEVLIDYRCRMAPLGTPIYQPQDGKEYVEMGKHHIVYNVPAEEIWNAEGKEVNETELKDIYELYLDTPYLWGGRSVFGIDCSGFAQQVFKFFGIQLLRDACLQAEQGEAVNGIEAAKLGDLAFFQNEKGRVTHVGILLNNNEIVHASGRVRIDSVNEEGILNRETGKRTHTLHSIRRFF
jgi:gamma-D-glutamyl-L-lysine dipeptidyl-peptidase